MQVLAENMGALRAVNYKRGARERRQCAVGRGGKADEEPWNLRVSRRWAVHALASRSRRLLSTSFDVPPGPEMHQGLTSPEAPPSSHKRKGRTLPPPLQTRVRVKGYRVKVLSRLTTPTCRRMMGLPRVPRGPMMVVRMKSTQAIGTLRRTAASSSPRSAFFSAVTSTRPKTF